MNESLINEVLHAEFLKIIKREDKKGYKGVCVEACYAGMTTGEGVKLVPRYNLHVHGLDKIISCNIITDEIVRFVEHFKCSEFTTHWIGVNNDRTENKQGARVGPMDFVVEWS